MPDDAPLYVVKGSTEAGIVKYWTGKMNGDWPEYLRDRERAVLVSQSIAKLMARQFNERAPNFDWTTEPAIPV
jgi:hypothetical protein